MKRNKGTVYHSKILRGLLAHQHMHERLLPPHGGVGSGITTSLGDVERGGSRDHRSIARG